ncbi:hypothetical protein [Sphingosinicella sp. BN140058]|uniref:hypothetical protein n=1 Tax=Sphingosinicella sp. BN140058 TaxID=1892855 RepID=UPI0010121328|nr:hypothetical protein [Sphingosinicella sp. BN140058]QAY80194.1 hypothetical protein ETR14_26490 [Sphingosinicella sp. BN140058]
MARSIDSGSSSGFAAGLYSPASGLHDVHPFRLSRTEAQAAASMSRVLQRLSFETHPILNRPVCPIEHDGEVVMLDEEELSSAAGRALAQVIAAELPRFCHLPDVRLDRACFHYLVRCAASDVPARWTI